LLADYSLCPLIAPASPDPPGPSQAIFVWVATMSQETTTQSKAQWHVAGAVPGPVPYLGRRVQVPLSADCQPAAPGWRAAV